jgi:hypothetical protein
MRQGGSLSILALTAVLSSAAHAQVAGSPDPATPAPTTEIGGSATIDVINLRANTLGIPLRHGGVLSGSERVDLNGTTLRRGEDYQIDLASGVIYLMRAIKQGDVLRVAYRWDKAKADTLQAKQSFSGISPFKFDLAPGQRMLLGFGMTERGADGNVIQSNIYGWNNAFSFGQANVKGLLMFGDRQRVEAKSDYEYQSTPGQTETGKSHFYLQDLKMGLGGGEIEVNYQDISKNFAGFAAAGDIYDANKLNQLKKERGLERFSLGMRNVDVGGLKLTNGYKKVGDGKDEIEWQNLGFGLNGFNISWNQRKIGQGFTRFNDLAEADREQLKREVGMSRESIAATFAQKTTKMSFNIGKVEDPDSNAINSREFSLETANIKFNLGEREVDRDFRRIGSLLQPEQAQYGRELGIKRQWMGLQAALFGPNMPLSFNQSLIDSENGRFTAEDYRFSGKGWSLEHVVREASEDFTAFGAMQDGERNEHINSIGRMYEPGGVPFRGEEVRWFNQSNGISRQLTRLSGAPFKDWNLRFDHLKLQGQEDGATVDTFVLDGKKIKLNYRQQTMGDDFNELSRTLDLERFRLGTISGLDRTDFSMNMLLSPNRSFLYAKMSAGSPEGGASREQLVFKDPRLSVEVTTREVDPAFAAGQLVDPEKDFLATLRGYKERDLKASWQIASNLKLDLFMLDSASDSLDQTKYIHNATLNWAPDKNTQIRAARLSQRNDDPLSILFANTIEQLSLTRNFGKLGTLRYASEKQVYDGTNNSLANMDRQFMAFETKLNAKTNLRSEATRTRWDDGKKEDIQTNVVSTELNPRMGVSVSNMQIDREGDERDEKKRNYGFWYDFGNGMRLIYGFAQHRAGETVTDTQNQNVQLSGGQVGNVAIGNGQYVENQWEGGRTQASGNIGLSTVKPMKFLGLTDFKINASMDTASDRAVWLKENQAFGFSGKLGTNALGFDYRSQIAANQLRGVDRSLFFTTDQDPSKPFRLSLRYKQRNLPTGEELHIRDYALTWRPAKGVELTHNLLTHPEVARGDVILGSITTAKRVNKWTLNVASGEDTTIGGSWEEMIDQGRPMTRLGGLNFVLFKRSGSPLNLFYGVEQADVNNDRRTAHRYHIRFDQRPGPNQTFSMFLGNVSYQHGLQDGWKRNNLTVQLDFQLKF